MAGPAMVGAPQNPEESDENIESGEDAAADNTDSSGDEACAGAGGCASSSSEGEGEEVGRGGGVAADPVDAALEAIGFGRFQFAMMAVCGMGWFVDSVEVGGLAYVYTTLDEQWGTTTENWGVLQSAKNLCSVGGALLFGSAADEFGRRPAFILALLLTAVGGLASAASTGFTMLLVLRCVANVGAGGILPVAISLLTEHLPPSKRDSCTVFMQIFFSVGHILAVVMSMLLLNSGSSWRTFIVGLAIPAALMLLVCPWVPESPSYLMMSGQEAKAQVALKRISRFNRADDVNFHLVSPQSTDGKGDSDLKRSKTGMIRIVSTPRLLMRMIMFGMLWALCMTGSDYATWITELGEKHGFHRHDVEVFMIVCKVVGVTAFLAAAFASRGGRGHVILRGSLAACAMAAALAACVVAGFGPKIALPASVLLLYFPYDMVWSLLYATTAKAFDPLCRASALSTASCFSRAAATVVPLASGKLLLHHEVLTTFGWAFAWLGATLVACAINFSEPGHPRVKVEEP